jgi:hypothetical protein
LTVLLSLGANSVSGLDDFNDITQEQLEEMAGPFYRGMGRAVARWQHVETGMFLLAHAIMGTNYKYSSTAYYMLNGANMKLQLVDRLCQAHFTKEVLKNEWAPTVEDIRNALKFRNGLAHFEVAYITDRSIMKPGDPPIALTSNHLDVRAAAKDSIPAATLSQITEAAELYLKLGRRLIWLVQRHFSPEALRATHLPPRWLQYLERGRSERSPD